jgi:hypothetical protein
MEEITRSLKSFSEAIDLGGAFAGLASKAASKPRPSPRTPGAPADAGRASPLAGPPGAAAGGEDQAAAAARRADLVLEQLDAGYFGGAAFDPLAHELGQLSEDSKQDDVDAVVDRLTAAVEVVSGRLKRHVLRNQDKLIQGITNVTNVDDDVKVRACMWVQACEAACMACRHRPCNPLTSPALPPCPPVKAAFVMARGARQQLRAAADDVAAQIGVVGSTRKKQRLMGALELAAHVRRVRELPLLLK